MLYLARYVPHHGPRKDLFRLA